MLKVLRLIDPGLVGPEKRRSRRKWGRGYH